MTEQQFYKSPLTIFVVWHPSNEDGIKYGEYIYNAFCRDTLSPLARGLNIPVYFRYINAPGGHHPIAIDAAASYRTAILLLADDAMFDDDRWHSYIDYLLDMEGKQTRLFPVALSKLAFSISEGRLNKKQFINLSDIKEKNAEHELNSRQKHLRHRMLHDLSRFFYKLEKVADAELQREEPPVKLFVSHAKKDGEDVAIQFRNYVQQHTKLKTFFDVNDIADAAEFEKAIHQNLKNSAIVVFLSDLYSTREWCRIEVIVAKRNQSPMVVVNNLAIGEKRSFPYLGNSPTIRYQESSFPDIIDLALYQVLNNLFFEEQLKLEVNLHELDKKYKVHVLENAPELFNYLDIKRIHRDDAGKQMIVLYPEPQLGTEELNVLNELDANITFLTPSLIHKTLFDGTR